MLRRSVPSAGRHGIGRPAWPTAGPSKAGSLQRPLSSSLSLRDALLTFAVMVVWGTNFVVIHIGVAHFPPLLFACLRFAFALLPLCAALILAACQSAPPPPVSVVVPSVSVSAAPLESAAPALSASVASA